MSAYDLKPTFQGFDPHQPHDRLISSKALGSQDTIHQLPLCVDSNAGIQFTTHNGRSYEIVTEFSSFPSCI